MRFRPSILIALCISIVLSLTPIVAAAVPPFINYHGFLTDNGGQPLNGAHDLDFAFFPDSTGGAALWQESHSDVQIAGGSFAVMLGSISALDPGSFAGTTVWIETTVDGVPLAPRRPMVSVGYAFRSEHADVADSLASGGPAVIHTPDTRPGCPAVTPASGILFAQNLALDKPTMVMISGQIIRRANGRVDLGLFVDGVEVKTAITHTPVLEWTTGAVQWGGALTAGAHVVELRSSPGSTWGCGQQWGAIDTIVFK